jgi:hypothetical protein
MVTRQVSGRSVVEADLDKRDKLPPFMTTSPRCCKDSFGEAKLFVIRSILVSFRGIIQARILVVWGHRWYVLGFALSLVLEGV